MDFCLLGATGLTLWYARRAQGIVNREQDHVDHLQNHPTRSINELHRIAQDPQAARKNFPSYSSLNRVLISGQLGNKDFSDKTNIYMERTHRDTPNSRGNHPD
jgi:hypothetical protein